jgi:hypothetical protein
MSCGFIPQWDHCLSWSDTSIRFSSFLGPTKNLAVSSVVVAMPAASTYMLGRGGIGCLSMVPVHGATGCSSASKPMSASKSTGFTMW